MPDVSKLLATGEGVFAKLFEEQLRASIERSYVLISHLAPSPPSLSAVAAKHFPRLAALVRYGRRMQEMTAAARYALGVRVIGYDPAPEEREW